MDNKLSLYNVAELLAEKTGLSQKEAEKYVDELILLIVEGITKDQLVKVKGIGTFKVILVKERESVHVNTGERIVIPAHHKLSFVPDKGFKEEINKPFSFFETIEANNDNIDLEPLVNDNFDEDDELPAQESVNETFIPTPTPPPAPAPSMSDSSDSEDLLDEEEEEENDLEPSETTAYNQPPIPASNKSAEAIEEEVHSISEDRLITNTPAAEKKEETQAVPKNKTSKKEPATKKTVQKKKGKKSYAFLYIILIFLLLVLGGCVWYYFSFAGFNNYFSDSNQGRYSGDSFALPGDSAALIEAQDKAKTDTTLTEVPTTNELNNPDTSSNNSQATVGSGAKVETNTQSSNKTESTSSKKPSITSGANTTTSAGGSKTIAKVKIEPGDRLTLLAEKYYGHKIFWVYIYEYNKSKIGTNPNNVPTGMQILIPAKDVYGIDANSSSSKDKARNLQSQIMSKF